VTGEELVYCRPSATRVPVHGAHLLCWYFMTTFLQLFSFWRLHISAVYCICGCYHILERCNPDPWPHVASHHMSISQLLSSCCYLFTVLNSGLLFYTKRVSSTPSQPRPLPLPTQRHRHIPERICEINSSIDMYSYLCTFLKLE